MDPFKELKLQLFEFSKSLASHGLLRDTAHFVDEQSRAIGYTKNQYNDFPNTKFVQGIDDFFETRLNEYEYDYLRLLYSRMYSFLLNCGTIIQIAFQFENMKIVKARYAFFQCPFRSDELFDSKDLVGTEVPPGCFRFDFDPKRHESVIHPACHLTIFEIKECRIPVSCNMDIAAFASFVSHNFLGKQLKVHSGSSRNLSAECMTVEERKMAHMYFPVS